MFVTEVVVSGGAVLDCANDKQEEQLLIYNRNLFTIINKDDRFFF